MHHFFWAFWETIFYVSHFYIWQAEALIALVLDYLFKDVSRVNRLGENSLEHRAVGLLPLIPNLDSLSSGLLCHNGPQSVTSYHLALFPLPPWN